MSQAVIPNPLYVLLEGGQYLTVGNVESMVFIDVDYYDNSTYRKIVDASVLGNAHQTITTQPTSTAAQTLATSPGVTPPSSPSGTAGLISESLSLSYSCAIEPAIIPPETTTSNPLAHLDSKFLVGSSDLIPGNTMKTMSVVQFWNSPSGAGSLVGEVMMDEVRGFSGTAPFNLN